jgi:uncharacterized cupin superfamily protein
MASKLPGEIKPLRRIVVRDNDAGTQSRALCDAPSPDVHLDPARPGFAAIEPPQAGSLCRYLQIPPDDVWKGKVGSKEVAAYFASMGSPGASTYAPSAPHPYMQKTRSLDFALILEGEVTLVLDLEEVHLAAGDTVVLRGSNHAWSNRSSTPCLIAMSMHDAS